MALTKIQTGGLADNSVTDAKVADAITVTGAQTGITQVGSLTGLTIDASDPTLTLKSDGDGNANTGYVAWQSDDGTSEGWLGYGSTSDSAFKLYLPSGNDHIEFLPNATSALTLTSSGATFAGDVTLSSGSYSGKLSIDGDGYTTLESLGTRSVNIRSTRGINFWCDYNSIEALDLAWDTGNAIFAGTITNAPSTDGAYAMFVNQQHATGWGLRIAGGADSSDNLINAQNGSGTEKFVVKSDGTTTIAGDVLLSGNNKFGSTNSYISANPTASDLVIYSGNSSAGDIQIFGRRYIYFLDIDDGNANRFQFDTSNGNATFTGAVSKGSGSFKIDHPLPSKKDTHYLVHSFAESPRADLIYRDKVTLVDGSATVNIDTVAGMTEGTFVLLCDNVQCFTSNESDWKAVKGSVTENILTIECEDSNSTADIAWMVIGDRKDKHIMETSWTDENGKPIIEPKKEALENA